MHNYHDAWGIFPPGLVDDDDGPTEALHTGFTLLLPFLEETALYNAYNFKAEAPPGTGGDFAPDAAGARGVPARRGWANLANSTVVSRQLAQFYCPSNRSEGLVKLGSPAFEAGACDYAMASGAIPLLCTDRATNKNVAKLRGFFGPNSSVRIKDVNDGMSLTVAMTEVSGGPNWVGTSNISTRQPRDSDAFGYRAADPQPWFIDQGWGVARIDGQRPNWPRGSTFVAAFQHLGKNFRADATSDELPAPINPKIVMISKIGQRPGDFPCGSRGDRLSPVRSLHKGGANFLMGDGTARFIDENVDLHVYSRVFTISGREILGEDDF